MIARTNPDLPWDPGPLVGRVEHDCEHLHGFPQCMGSAAGDACHCTCSTLTALQHLQAEEAARFAHRRRRGRPCVDCLFLSKDPEEEFEIRQLARSEETVYCHAYMPLSGVGGVVQRDCFMPHDERAYPVCAGWQKARKRELRRRWHLEIIK